MDDVEVYVDANESYNAKPKSNPFLAYCKKYWLALVTFLVSAVAIIQSSFIKLNLSDDTGAPLVMLPALFFLRHVRGFVVLFVIFSAASKTAVLFETKRSTVKRKVLLNYFLATALTLVVSLVAAYLIILRRDKNVVTTFFSTYLDKDYRSISNFIRFVRGLAVHDLPGNALTTRVDNFNELGLEKLHNGLGDGYNAPGFIVFGVIICLSTYFLGKEGEILRNLVNLVHQSLLGVYWMLLCYSPIALYFGGIVQYDLVKRENLYGFLCMRYLLLIACTAVVTLIQVFVILPFLHFCRTGRFGYDVLGRLLPILPNTFVGGSTVLMVDHTKEYLKSKRFCPDVVDTYLKYCTLINGAGIASGFVINAIFSLKLNAHDFDWAIFVKIILTGLLVSLALTEYIQGYMFGIIYFLNTSMINPDFIILILLVDWFNDRMRIVSNMVSDALMVDYVESMNKKSGPVSQTA